MTTNSGVFLSNQFTAEHARRSFIASLVRHQPAGAASLYALTSMLKKDKCIATEHGYFSKAMIFPSVTLDGAVIAGDTTFTVDDSSQMLPGMVMRDPNTGENIMVNTVPTATSITVTRAAGTTAAAGIADNTQMMVIGTANEEASNRPTAMNVQPTLITNLTQIFRNSWHVSGTVRATMMEAGEGNVAESKMDCAMFHSQDIEKALLFSEKYSGTRNGNPFRKMDGALAIIGNATYYPPSYASPNVTTAGGTTNYTQLENMLEPTLDQNSSGATTNERLVFTGATGLKVINNIGRLSGEYQLAEDKTSFGLQFRSFKTARGTFTLIEHPLLNANAVWSKMAVVLDLNTINLAYLGDRDTKREEYGSDGSPADAGQDAVGGSLLSELTLCIKNPPANAVIHNLTAAA